MNLADFYDQLKRHDWFYAMSDDNRVYKAGVADYERLRTLSKTIEGGVELMSAFQAHYSAAVTGGEQPPLPERPESEPRDMRLPTSDREVHPS